jgi:hypothetical protein
VHWVWETGVEEVELMVMDELEEEEEFDRLAEETVLDVLDEVLGLQVQHAPEQGPHVPEQANDSPALQT